MPPRRACKDPGKNKSRMFLDAKVMIVHEKIPRSMILELTNILLFTIAFIGIKFRVNRFRK